MCIFCKIISGEIPSYKVYEDDYFLAFLDISQTTYGHTLIIPKEHYANLLEMPDELLDKLMIVVKKVAKGVKIVTKCEGFNVLNNNGEVAGQSVQHFHIHIIPRYPNDSFKIIPSENILTDSEFSNLQKNISNNI